MQSKLKSKKILKNMGVLKLKLDNLSFLMSLSCNNFLCSEIGVFTKLNFWYSGSGASLNFLKIPFPYQKPLPNHTSQNSRYGFRKLLK